MKIRLTEEQREIVRKSGRYVVRAVPGSGKTLTVACKVIHLLRNWEYKHHGIAVLSFTNVAWQEIDKCLKDEGVKMAYPHFLGTLDSFINQYIFRPFIKTYIFSQFNRHIESIKMYGQPYNDWNPIGNGYYWRNSECYSYKCDIRTISYDLMGNLIDFKPNSHFRTCSVNPSHENCKRLKELLVKDGSFTQNDANYYALQIITRFPSIAKVLIKRFPVFIIDEAQDTSEVQMAIIDRLVEAGLEEVVLIGDPDQAIFEWRDAKPESFNEKMIVWETIELSGNWRSSQKICDFYKKISSASEIIAKNEEVKDYLVSPEIWGYSGNDHLKTLINDFVSLCKSQNIEVSKKKIAIVFRSKDFINNLLGDSGVSRSISPWKLPDSQPPQDDESALFLAKAKLLQENGDFREAINFVEKALCRFKFNNKFCRISEFKQIYDEFGMINWRILCREILLKLPSTENITLKDWTNKTNDVLRKKLAAMKMAKNEIVLKEKGYKDKKFREKIKLNRESIDNEKYYIGTIHSVKGQTFEALMLVVKRKAAGNKFYRNLLGNSDIREEEEIRNIYVAMSRPRKILIVAVPEADKEFWERRFLHD